MGIALRADIEGYENSMSAARGITSGFSGVLRGLGNALRTSGAIMTVGAGMVGAAMFGLSRRAEKVNAAFREVDSISQEVSDAQKEYGQLVSDLNTEFGLQADRIEVIEGLYSSISAGVSEGSDSQREFLETAGQLAVVGRVDLATTVDVLSTVMNTYGMETSEARDVSRSLFQTVQFGKVRKEELAPVLGRVAALGSEMSVKIDEIGASMAVLTRTGFEARVAATGLRNVFRSMMRPSDSMKEVLREVALENVNIARQWNQQSDLGNDLANTYQQLTGDVGRLQQAQEDARRAVEENSLVIQEARLKIQAIEEDRLDQLGNLNSKQVESADSVSDLESIIDDYRFQVNQARVVEEQHRLEMQAKQDRLAELRQDFKDNVDIQGDLEGGVGELVLQEQDFVETLVDLLKRADENNIAMSELFPRTRSLQAALALVGEDGQLLIEVFEEMNQEGANLEQIWEANQVRLTEQFDGIEDFKKSTEALTEEDALQQWYDEMTGEQQKMRDATSELRETVVDLGNIFNEEFTDAVSNIADAFADTVDWIHNLRESTKDNFSQFAVLAVSIGLVVGPLLVLLGTLFKAASLGLMLIPLAGLAVFLVGGLGSALQDASGGGAAAEIVIQRMEETLSSLVGFVIHLKDLFMRNLLPAMVFVFDSAIEVLGEFRGHLDDIGGIGTQLRPAFVAVMVTLLRFGRFLRENKEAIASYFATIVVLVKAELPVVASLISTVIATLSTAIEVLIGLWEEHGDTIKASTLPALMDWFQGVKDVLGSIRDYVRTDEFKMYLTTLFTLLLVVIDTIAQLLGVMGRLTSLVAPALVPALRALAVGLTIQIAVLTAAIGIINVAIRVIGLWIDALSFLTAKLEAVSGVLIGVIAVFSPLIGTVLFAASAVRYAANQIAGAFQRLFEKLVEVSNGLINGIRSILLGELYDTSHSAFEKTDSIATQLIRGLKLGIDTIREATDSITTNVEAYLPSSPAAEGHFSANPPKEIGKSIPENVAAGMKEGEGQIEIAAESLTDEQLADIEVDLDINGSGSFPISGEHELAGVQSETIEIGERTFTFEEGLFTDITEEEIPEKVGEVIYDEFKVLVDDPEGV